MRLVWILSDLFSSIYSSSKNVKNALFKGLISHYLKMRYPLKFIVYKASRSQEYTLGTLTIDSSIFTTFWIILTALLLIFLFSFFHFFHGSYIPPWCFTVIFSQGAYRLVPAQDRPFFYTRSHFSALQNCAVFFSTNFQIIFILKECITQFSHWIVSCAILFSKIIYSYIWTSRTVL